MARNSATNSQVGAVKKRSQTINTKTGLYVKRDAVTGKFLSVKINGRYYKGVTIEEIKKMGPVLKKLSDYDKKGKHK
ncbi:MAG: hypothetical protein ACKVT2_16510 [Saprospiraceae bacterium]